MSDKDGEGERYLEMVFTGNNSMKQAVRNLGIKFHQFMDTNFLL